MKTNNICRTNITMEEYIWRYIPLKYFLQILDKRSLYIPRINKWEDPYELFLFKQHFVDTAECPIDVMSQSERIYGVCWTTARDSDALWRIYSPDLMSVRIKTTIGKIKSLESQMQGKNLFMRSSFVEYKTQYEIESWIKSLIPTSMMDLPFVDSLFIKRNSFSHEKEYRLILWDADFDEKNHYKLHSEGHLDLPIDPSDFILEVYLDPRLSKEEVVLLKHAIALRLGNTCPVSQSRLYQIKPNKIII